MANQELNAKSLKKMICEVLENTKMEVINREPEYKLYDRGNTLEIIEMLIIAVQENVAADDTPDSPAHLYSMSEWSLHIDATVHLKVNKERHIRYERKENKKYNLKCNAKSIGDNQVYELEVTYKHSVASLGGVYQTFIFDKDNRILSYEASRDYCEGIDHMWGWKRAKDEL